jgi:hypothetical protein
MSATPQDAFQTTYVAPSREVREDAAVQWVVGVFLLVAAGLAWAGLA